MIAYGRKSVGATRRRAIDVAGDVFHKGEWMEQNQFQLFVDGQGTIGPEQIRPITVHYAGAYTGYGPIMSGPQGLKYFTIRSAFESGLIPAT